MLIVIAKRINALATSWFNIKYVLKYSLNWINLTTFRHITYAHDMNFTDFFPAKGLPVVTTNGSSSPQAATATATPAAPETEKKQLIAVGEERSFFLQLGGGNSNIWYFQPILTNIFQMGWNNQQDSRQAFLKKKNWLV